MNLRNPLESRKPKAKSCTELLFEYEKRKRESGKEAKPEGAKLKFLGAEPKDVYNPTPPFPVNGTMILAVRVETREDDARSSICFFRQEDDAIWIKIEDAPVFGLEDPFAATVGGEIIIGGVEVFHQDEGNRDLPVGYRTVFYKGTSLATLEKFAVGPEKMKDIRLIELPNGHIGVCTRPQDGIYGRGRIGYIELDSLEDLNPENISQAKIIEDQFAPGEWGGANQLHLLETGKIGVIGHIACFDEKDKKHYYGMKFVLDTKTGFSLPIEIIATRNDFPKGDAKKPDLKDVIFTGGITKEGDGKYYLYTGLSDAEAGKISIDYPF